MNSPNRLKFWLVLGLAAVTVTLAGVGVGKWIGGLDVGYVSRWHVPAHIWHDGLRYSLDRPITYMTRARMSTAEPPLRAIGSTSGLRMFAIQPEPDPAEIYVQPKGRSCFIDYSQYAEVG